MLKRDQTIASRSIGPNRLDLYQISPIPDPDGYYFDSSSSPIGYAYTPRTTLYGESSTIAQLPGSGLRGSSKKKRDYRSAPRNWHSFFHHRRVIEDNAVGSVNQPVIVWCNTYPDLGFNFLGAGVIRDVHSVNWLEHYGEVGRFDKGLPSFIDEPFDEFVRAPNNIDDMIRTALTAMVPTIRNEVSSLNFIREFEEIFSLYHFTGDLRAKFRSLKEVVSSALRKAHIPKSSELSWKELARLAAEGHLEWSFNIKPLMSDVRGFYRSYSKFASDLGKGVNIRSGFRTSHYTTSWNEYDDDDSGFSGTVERQYESDPYSFRHYLSTRRKVTYFPSIFNAQLQYNANYTAFQAQYPELLAFLDRIGVVFNPRIIWDALPWTFVIDWFADVGEFFDKMKVTHMEPDINIVQFSWSISRERLIECSFHDFFGNSLDRNANVRPAAYYKYPTIRETAYRRQVGMPGVGVLPFFKVPGFNQVTLGVALAITAKRHRYRHRGR